MDATPPRPDPWPTLAERFAQALEQIRADSFARLGEQLQAERAASLARLGAQLPADTRAQLPAGLDAIVEHEWKQDLAEHQQRFLADIAERARAAYQESLAGELHAAPDWLPAPPAADVPDDRLQRIEEQLNAVQQQLADLTALVEDLWRRQPDDA